MRVNLDERKIDLELLEKTGSAPKSAAHKAQAHGSPANKDKSGGVKIASAKFQPSKSTKRGKRR